jgi:hypothetical protein
MTLQQPADPAFPKMERRNYLRGFGVFTRRTVLDMRSLVLLIVPSSFALATVKWGKETQKAYVSEAAATALVLYQVPPVCPKQACSLCTNSAVRLRVIVGKSGVVKAASRISGDLSLAGAATNAVTQWRCERYILNGSPVEFETRVTLTSWVCRT